MFTNIPENQYGIKQRATNLFITFFFVFFFFQFFRKIATNGSIDNQTIITETILFMIWYSLTLILT